MRLLSVLLLLLSPLLANAVVIDFEDVPYGTGSSAISSNGFDFEQIEGTTSQLFIGTPDAWDGNDIGFCSVCGLAGFTFSGQSGSLFSVQSLEFTFYSALSGFNNLSFFVTGVSSSGSTVSKSLNLDPHACNYDPESCASYYESQGVQSFSDHSLLVFDAEWTDLVEVSIATNGPSGGIGELLTIDNIAVNVVPIPAAAYLFASGLGLLGWFRRRQSP